MDRFRGDLSWGVLQDHQNVLYPAHPSHWNSRLGPSLVLLLRPLGFSAPQGWSGGPEDHPYPDRGTDPMGRQHCSQL